MSYAKAVEAIEKAVKAFIRETAPDPCFYDKAVHPKRGPLTRAIAGLKLARTPSAAAGATMELRGYLETIRTPAQIEKHWGDVLAVLEKGPAAEKAAKKKKG